MSRPSRFARRRPPRYRPLRGPLRIWLQPQPSPTRRQLRRDWLLLGAVACTLIVAGALVLAILERTPR